MLDSRAIIKVLRLITGAPIRAAFQPCYTTPGPLCRPVMSLSNLHGRQAGFLLPAISSEGQHGHYPQRYKDLRPLRQPYSFVPRQARPVGKVALLLKVVRQ